MNANGQVTTSIMPSVIIRRWCFYGVLLCFIWFPVQDLLISLLYRLYPTIYWLSLSVFKETLIALILILLFLRKMLLKEVTISLIEIIGLFYILFFCFPYFLWRPKEVSTLTALTTFRSAILPIILLLVGKWLNVRERELTMLVKVVVFVSVISILFGFVEMVIPVNKLWNGVLDLHGYLTTVKGLRLGFIKNVPGNFWGFVGIRRMAGTFASPLALGYFLIVPILLLFSSTYLTRKKVFILLFLICGLLLTETRAAIMGTIIGIFLYHAELSNLLAFKMRKRFLSIFLVFFLIFAILLIYSPTRNFFLASMTRKEGRIIGHIKALERSLVNVQETILMGKGFGLAGCWATMQSGKISGAGESAYLSVMYQIGGIGLLTFLIWWFLIVFRLQRQYLKCINNDLWRNLCKAMVCLSLVYFLTGLISEQILTFSSVAHFWILTGALLGSKKEETNN